MAPVINAKNLYKNVFNTKLMKKWIPDDPSKGAAGLALASTITKDALNCYYYTTQSYHNKKIPEDKRKFVAAIDLSNGIVNVLVPLLTQKWIKQFSDTLFESKFAKYFSGTTTKNMYEKLKAQNITCSFDDVANIVEKTSRKWAKAGLAVIATLVASQVICKRVITPSLSTPLADVVKKQFEKYEATHPEIKTESTDAAQSQKNEQPNPFIYVINTNTFKDFDDLVTKAPKFHE